MKKILVLLLSTTFLVLAFGSSHTCTAGESSEQIIRNIERTIQLQFEQASELQEIKNAELSAENAIRK